MAQVQPPVIPPGPEKPQRGDRVTFKARVDAFIAWFIDNVPVVNSLAQNVYNNALDAFQNALSASASAASSSSRADASAASATDAANSAANASASATSAAASAAAAAGTQLIATSASDLPIGTGDKVFVVGAGKQFALNVPVIAVDSANAARYLSGTVKAYAGTSLTIAVTDAAGAGNCASWNIAVAGIKGVKGDTGSAALSGTASGAINWNGTVLLASAATVNIGAAASNDLVISGSTAITAFDNVAAGVTRKVKFVAPLVLTFNVSTLILPGLANITTAANDTAQFTSLGGGQWICDWYKRADGRAVVSDTAAAPFTCIAVLTTSQTWNTRVAGPHRVTIIGGGGSGAIYKSQSFSGQATGGGAGALCRKVFNATAGQALTFVIGTGGVAKSQTVHGGQNGANGNASTMTTSGVSLVANGGFGGQYTIASVQNNPVTTSTPGGAGGTASGGDQNNTGGAGGTANGTGSITSYVATGGGAVNWYGGTPYVGGAASVNPSTLNNAQAASGGAGIGGDGGSAVVTIANSCSPGGGGGTGGPGSPGANNSGGNGGPAVGYTLPPLNFNGVGAYGSPNGAAAPGGDGAGGGGSASSQSTGGSSGGNGGRLAGGGGSAGSSPENTNGARGGNGLWGGAGAGCAGYGISYSYSSGAGGDGVAMVEWCG